MSDWLQLRWYDRIDSYPANHDCWTLAAATAKILRSIDTFRSAFRHWQHRSHHVNDETPAGSGRNGNEAVAASETFARWLHRRYAPSNCRRLGAYRFAAVEWRFKLGDRPQALMCRAFQQRSKVRYRRVCVWKRNAKPQPTNFSYILDTLFPYFPL